MDRRGVSHVEVVLSFVIFAAAIGFALYFFSPSQGDRLVDTSLGYVFKEIEQNASLEIEVFRVWLNSSFISEDILAINLSGVDSKKKSSTWSPEGDFLQSSREVDGDLLFIDNGGSGWGDSVEIRLSEEFEGESVSPVTHDKNLYLISSSDEKTILTEKKIEELNESYYLDYLKLKNEFNLPNRVHFGFSLNVGSVSINAGRDIPHGLEVFSRIERVEVLRKDGAIEFGDLVVRVW